MQFSVDAGKGAQHPIGARLCELICSERTLNGQHLFELTFGQCTAVLCGNFQRH